MKTFYLTDNGTRLVLDTVKHGDVCQTIEAENWLEAREQVPTHFFEKRAGYGYPAGNLE